MKLGHFIGLLFLLYCSVLNCSAATWAACPNYIYYSCCIDSAWASALWVNGACVVPRQFQSSMCNRDTTIFQQGNKLPAECKLNEGNR